MNTYKESVMNLVLTVGMASDNIGEESTRELLNKYLSEAEL